MGSELDRLNAAMTGHYAVEKAIGAGGMATVYLARDLKHQRKVAVKVLLPDVAAAIGGERFLAEIVSLPRCSIRISCLYMIPE